MAASHRGAIFFGMVHIPLGLYTAAQGSVIHLNRLRIETVHENFRGENSIGRSASACFQGNPGGSIF